MITYCPLVETLFTRQRFIELYEILLEVRQKGNWIHLKEIPSPLRGTHLRAYNALCLAYYNNLTTLWFGDRVHCLQGWSMEEITHYHDLFFEMGTFPRLTELEVKVYKSQSFFELETVLSRCSLSPCLHVVRFSPFQPNPSKAYNENHLEHDDSMISNLADVKPLPSVHTFEGDRIMLSDASVQYLIHKFPKVKYFTLNRLGQLLRSMVHGGDDDMGPEEFKPIRQVCECNGTLDQLFRLSADTQMAFFQYLNKMDQFYICGSVGWFSVRSLVENFFKATVGNKNILQPTYAQEPERSEQRSEPDVKISKEPSSTHNKYDQLQYLLDEERQSASNGRKNNTCIVQIHSRFVQIRGDFIFAQLGDQIQHLDVSLDSPIDELTDLDYRVYQQDMMIVLNAVLAYCHHLITLKISHINIGYVVILDANSTEINKTVKNIELVTSAIAQGGLAKLSKHFLAMDHLTLNQCYFDGPKPIIILDHHA